MPTAPEQPAGMQNTNGCIVTVGIRTPQDRAAIVLPVATDNDSAGARQLCAACGDAVEESLLDLICACIGASAYVTFVQAEGMVDGMIPVRADYGILDHPGTRTGPGECSQIAGLMMYYALPEDLPLNHRMVVSKNFLPGLSDTDVSGDYIADDVVTAMEAFLAAVTMGFAGTTFPEVTFYRVMSAPRVRTPGTQLVRVGLTLARKYVGTQRRRLIPRA